MALLDGLPYAAVWGNHYKTACRKVPIADRGIYGEAGYWLAMAVIELADDVGQSPVYQRLIADASGDTWLAEFASFSTSLAAPSTYPLVRTQNQLPFNAARWRARCTLMPCRIDEQGEQFPFEFPPVATEVINNPELVGEQDHMYARTNAQRLIRFVRAQWDRYRTEVVPEMEIVVSAKDKNARHRDLEFRVGAATLRHGGAHPPHKTHRNGAMFDVAVRGILPLHCKGQPEISDEDEAARARRNGQGYHRLGAPNPGPSRSDSRDRRPRKALSRSRPRASSRKVPPQPPTIRPRKSARRAASGTTHAHD